MELFERGYGKDSAGIAKDAIAYGKSGKKNLFDNGNILKLKMMIMMINIFIVIFLFSWCE